MTNTQEIGNPSPRQPSPTYEPDQSDLYNYTKILNWLEQVRPGGLSSFLEDPDPDVQAGAHAFLSVGLFMWNRDRNP